MTHRKNEHISRVCRYFQNDSCKFTKEQCWYRHSKESPMDIDNDSYSCNFCELKFDGMDSMMKHKKGVHKSSKQCRKYLEGGCKRSENECWFNHPTNMKKSDLDFQSVPRVLPPDKLEQILMDLVSKVSKMEKMVSQFQTV